MSSKSCAIGIDLGTSNSCVAYIDKKQIKCITNNGTKNNTFPSTVFIPSDGAGIFISSEAITRGAPYPANFIYCVKRIMGATELGPKDIVNYKIAQAPGGNGLVIRIPAAIPGISDDEEPQYFDYTPVDISSFILNFLRSYAEATFNENRKSMEPEITADKAVITVPAAFTSEQRRLTRLAARLAGLECLRILSEPTAAALAYLYNNFHDETLKQQINLDPNKPLNLLVFDLGGGTFDVSVVSIAAGGFLVRATSGNNYFGGQDIDNAIIKDLMKLYAKESMAKGFSSHQSKLFVEDEELSILPQKMKPSDLKHNEKCKRLLREQAIKIKEHLSDADSYTFEVYSVEWKSTIDFKFTYTSKRLTALVTQMYNKYCAPTVDDALSKADLAKEDIYRCILVGGSTRIPSVAHALRSFFFGAEPARDINPDEAVAKGAAYLATYLASKQDRNQIGAKLNDMNFAQISLNTGELSAFQYGIAIKDHPAKCVISAGSPLPASDIHTIIIQNNLEDPHFDINVPLEIYIYEQESHQNTEYVSTQKKDPLFTIYVTKQRIKTQTLSFYLKLDQDGVLDVYYSCDNGYKYSQIHNLDDDDSLNALNDYIVKMSLDVEKGHSENAQVTRVPPPPPPPPQRHSVIPRIPQFVRIPHQQPLKPSLPPDLLPRPDVSTMTRITENPAPFEVVYMQRYRANNANRVPSVLFPTKK